MDEPRRKTLKDEKWYWILLEIGFILLFCYFASVQLMLNNIQGAVGWFGIVYLGIICTRNESERAYYQECMFFEREEKMQVVNKSFSDAERTIIALDQIRINMDERDEIIATQREMILDLQQKLVNTVLPSPSRKGIMN